MRDLSGSATKIEVRAVWDQRSPRSANRIPDQAAKIANRTQFHSSAEREHISLCNREQPEAALDRGMEILIAIELIIAAIFVIGCWYRNPQLMLWRRSCQHLLNPYEDDEKDDARIRPPDLI
jgi:hypothetical protein